MATVPEVSAYYDEYTADYLMCSDIIQVGRFSDDDDEQVRILAARAGVRGGDQVLDCGCGVGGVMRRLATWFPSAAFDGVTISSEQVRIARQRLRESPRCRVELDNFEQLSARDQSYDLVLFCETLGYANSIDRALAEAFRVLRPGGRIYIKEVLACERPLTDTEQEELTHYMHSWLYTSLRPSVLEGLLQRAGFIIARADHCYTTELLSPVTTAYKKTRLGRRHPVLQSLPPLTYGDFVAYRPT
jgi:ubiquinone/menaquinone biosynthesis C-methylase UbiE